jgi:CheY-like chemotaxis protein
MAAHILIAEDEPDIRDFLVAVVRSGGHEAVEAANGAEVLRRLAEPAPDLVLMDLHMPVLSGLDAMEQIAAVPGWANVPVVFLTASGYSDDMVRARSLGARGYLVKPIRLADLLAKIAMVLEDKSLLWLDDITRSRAT